MSEDFKPGEIVTITIKGARVDEWRPAVMELTVDSSADANSDLTTFTLASDQVTVEHVAPAEWPPRHHDVWRDRFGDLWIARVLLSTPDERLHVEMHGVGDDVFAADTMLAKYGPMTLVHREGGAS